MLAQGYVAQATVDNDKSNLVAAQSAVQAAQTAAQQARSQAAASSAQAQASIAQTTSQSDAIAAAHVAAAGSADTAQASSAAIGIQEANVQTAETNLANSVIKSPVDGTVIARDVSVGTTVAASLQTPTLFAIAQDLSKMEVDLAVGEPDIGSVKNGENVDFTVLAFPNRTFHGVVSQVRKNPVITSNVVTYTTVVLVDNNDQALLPGMTANATIDVQKAANALVVPLSALSFQPSFNGTHKRAAGATGTRSRHANARSAHRPTVPRRGAAPRAPRPPRSSRVRKATCSSSATANWFVSPSASRWSRARKPRSLPQATRRSPLVTKWSPATARPRRLAHRARQAAANPLTGGAAAAAARCGGSTNGQRCRSPQLAPRLPARSKSR